MTRESIIAKVMLKLSYSTEPQLLKMFQDEKVEAQSIPRTTKTFFEHEKYDKPRMINFLDQMVASGIHKKSNLHFKAIELISKMFHLDYQVKP